MRATTIPGVVPVVDHTPARWALPDLADCTVEQLVGMAYSAAMEVDRYEVLVASPAHVQAILALVLRFDATLSVVLEARASQECLITSLLRQLKGAQVVIWAYQQERRAERRRADTDRDDIPPAMNHFEEIRDDAAE